MKKKTAIVSLILSLAMVLGAFQAVFAGVPGFESLPNLKNEMDVENLAIKVANETVDGGYTPIHTDGVKSYVGTDAIILDTMPPADSYNAYHVPGAINFMTPLTEAEFTADAQKELLSTIDKATGVKRTTQYYNKKTKKWQTKKIKDAKTRTKISNKAGLNKVIIVYCGFTKCARSHVAAKYLVKKGGYKNVYRYVGGISAWLDAGYETEAAPVETTPAQ